MKQFEEPIYIDEKKAANRYGLSTSWFQRERWKGTGPKFIKVNGAGKILYPVNETDQWFASFYLRRSTSDNFEGV